MNGRGKKVILVFGALNMDMVMRVPEMPRPSNTVVCPGYSFIPGGKGANQAAAAALSGARVRMYGCVGKDDFAKQLRHSLGDAGVNTDALHVIPDAPTGCAAICVDQGGENMIVVAAGANEMIKSSLIADEEMSSQNLVVTQCEVPQEETWELLRRAKAREARTLLNLAPARKIPTDLLGSVDYLVMNEIETTILSLHLGFESISPSIAARRITSTYGTTCIVTLGSHGAFASSPSEEWEVPALRITSVDTTAAGDAFCGAFASRIHQHDSFHDALRFAAVASSLTCTRMGAQTSLPTLQETKEALSKLPPLKKLR